MITNYKSFSCRTLAENYLNEQGRASKIPQYSYQSYNFISTLHVFIKSDKVVQSFKFIPLISFNMGLYYSL